MSGLYEAATWQIHDHAVIGVQKMTTPTTLSAISCTNSAGTTKITAGDELIFTWQFSGVGSATCTHDGVAVSNVMNNVNCVSPLSITAKDVSSTDTAHTVAVTFTDVCGRERTAQYQYTQTGVKAVTSTEILNSDGAHLELMSAIGEADSSLPWAAYSMHACTPLAHMQPLPRNEPLHIRRIHEACMRPLPHNEPLQHSSSHAWHEHACAFLLFEPYLPNMHVPA